MPPFARQCSGMKVLGASARLITEVLDHSVGPKSRMLCWGLKPLSYIVKGSLSYNADAIFLESKT